MPTPVIFAIEWLLVAFTALIILKASVPREPLGDMLRAFVNKASRDSAFRLFLILLFGTLFLAAAESLIDERITYALGKNFTKSFYRFEGLFGAFLQRFEHPALTWTMSVFYVFVFPAMILCFPVLFAYTNDRRGMFQLVFYMMFNLIIALPFYIFFPVKEVWVEYSPSVRPLLLDINPYIACLFKYTNGINNCFPSLHVSITLSLFMISLSTPFRLFKIANLINTCCMVFSTLYLGIHWMLDVIGGVGVVLTINVLYRFVRERYEIPAVKKGRAFEKVPVAESD